MDLDEAMTDLVSRYGDRLLRVGFQLTHDRASAQDLVQEALLRVWSTAHRDGREPQDWYAYLRRCVINEYLRTRRLLSSTEVVTDLVPNALIVESAEGRVDDRAAVWAALGRLSARQRAVLVLRYYESLQDGEIAALLGCRAATVRSLASRGLAAMRQHAVLTGVTERDAT
jgi:RNA polymerase sigma factor (sigma-70 family)